MAFAAGMVIRGSVIVGVGLMELVFVSGRGHQVMVVMGSRRLGRVGRLQGSANQHGSRSKALERDCDQHQPYD